MSSKIHQTDTVVNRQNLADFTSILHRGGDWHFIQTPSGGETGDKRSSHYMPVDRPLTTPPQWATDIDLFFGVNPTSTYRPAYQAAHTEDIVGLNCLYSDFDGKDETNPTADEVAAQLAILCTDPTNGNKNLTVLTREATIKAKAAKYATDPAHYNQLALARVNAQEPAPSVIVFTGGGYQCYWLLTSTYHITDDHTRAVATHVQKAWVERVGADPGAVDLRRILRFPGSRNHKRKYAPDYPQVAFVRCDLETTYSFAELAALVPPYEPPQPAQPKHKAAQPNTAQHRGPQTGPQTTPVSSGDSPSVINTYNNRVSIVDALASYGYKLSNSGRWVRPGGDSPSVTLFETTSYHHNPADPLYSDKPRSAFDAFCVYEYGGDVRAAVRAAAILLGMAPPAPRPSIDWSALRLWIRTTNWGPTIKVDPRTYQSDSTDTRTADAVIDIMSAATSTSITTSARPLGKLAGVHPTTALRALARLSPWLFETTIGETGITIKLAETHVRAFATLWSSTEGYSSSVANARTGAPPDPDNQYSPRKGTDPFLVGVSRQVRDSIRAEAVDLDALYKKLLDSVPKALGESCLRILDALLRTGAATLDELTPASGKTRGAAYRAAHRLAKMGLLTTECEGRFKPITYDLAADVWTKIDALTPVLRTTGLAAEREDRQLKESQLYAQMQEARAKNAGDDKAAAVQHRRFERFTSRRVELIPQVFGHILASGETTMADVVNMVTRPRRPLGAHPATKRKVAAEAAKQADTKELHSLFVNVRRMMGNGIAPDEMQSQLVDWGFPRALVDTAVGRVVRLVEMPIFERVGLGAPHDAAFGQAVAL